MKKLILALLAISLLLCFAACGGTGADDSMQNDASSDNQEATSNDAAPDTEDNVLTMVTEATFAPYEYYEGTEIVGIDVEIAQLLADKLDMELDVQDIAFDSIIPAVQTGKADMGMAGMTVDEERLESVNFSHSYATGVIVVLVAADSEISSIDDLSAGGYTIGAQTGTTGELYATWDFEDEGLGTVERFNKYPDAVQALISGKVDCVFIDNEPAKSYVAANEGLKILETPYANEEYAICVAKDNTALLDSLNTALDELIADGSVQEIIDKYITAE